MPTIILDREFSAIVTGQLSTLCGMAHMAATPEDLAYIQGQIVAIRNLAIGCGLYTPQVKQALAEASEIEKSLVSAPAASVVGITGGNGGGP